MFEYETRLERKDGCKFIEQDILLYDYIYSDDISIETAIEYKRPGFGFVISEQQNNVAVGDNIYIFKIDKPNHYQIITRKKGEQVILRSEYIDATASFDLNEDMILVMDFSNNCQVKIYRATKNEYKTNDKHLMFSYEMPHVMDRYKVGFYSNAGNTIKFSAISSESPSNWISNIFNGRGGRINWIKNGFEIQECEFNCEVESQINELEAGTYYFSFNTDNPKLKYYIYPSYRRDPDIKRTMDEILSTKEDERKNILDYKNNSFTLKEKQNINIKFVGKTGKVTEIAIKKAPGDLFIETDYDNTKKEPSFFTIDMSLIEKAEIEAIISDAAEKHYVFLNGIKKYTTNDLGIKLNDLLKFTIENRTVTFNGKQYKLSDDENKLYCFKNLDAVISKFVVTFKTGEAVDIINQKTVKITVDKNIKSPIIVTDKNNNPLELSSSYRKVIQPKEKTEFYNRFKEIKLNGTLSISNKNLYVFGSKQNGYELNTTSVEKSGYAISPNDYDIDVWNNKIKIKKEVRDQYKYIGVKYTSIDDYIYEFTNWQRELFSLDNGYIYLKDVVNDYTMIVYGIPKEAKIDKDRLYHTSKKELINSIDEMAAEYVILTADEYNLNTTTNKLTIDNPEKYDYIVVDYLKDNSYSINERNNYYEVDISGHKSGYIISYDNISSTYKTISFDNMKTDNFIVLRKKEE